MSRAHELGCEPDYTCPSIDDVITRADRAINDLGGIEDVMEQIREANGSLRDMVNEAENIIKELEDDIEDLQAELKERDQLIEQLENQKEVA